MKCPTCKATIKEKDRYCPSCGRNIKGRIKDIKEKVKIKEIKERVKKTHIALVILSILLIVSSVFFLNKVADLNNQITNLDSTVVNLNNKIRSKDNAIAEKDDIIGEKREEIFRLNEEIKSLEASYNKKIQILESSLDAVPVDIVYEDKTQVRYLTPSSMISIGGKVNIIVYPKDSAGNVVKTAGRLDVKMYTSDKKTELQRWSADVSAKDYTGFLFGGLQKKFYYSDDMSQYEGKSLYLEITLETPDGSRFRTHYDGVLL